MHHFLRVLGLVLLFSAASTVSASEFVLPSNASDWINSSPLTLEGLKGKGIVLYFFEEQ